MNRKNINFVYQNTHIWNWSMKWIYITKDKSFGTPIGSTKFGFKFLHRTCNMFQITVSLNEAVILNIVIRRTDTNRMYKTDLTRVSASKKTALSNCVSLQQCNFVKVTLRSGRPRRVRLTGSLLSNTFTSCITLNTCASCDLKKETEDISWKPY